MQFVDKKIAVLGLGLEAIDLVTWIKEADPQANITVFDQRDKKELKEELKDLSGFKNVNYYFGPDCFQKISIDFDIIFRSPGVHRLDPQIIKAEKKCAEISSVTKMFFRLCPCPIIGVTGTKGKGTTAALIAKILRASSKSIYLAGNIGKSPLGLLNKLKQTDLVCLELSSFQLQDLDYSPHIAVVLDITSEHLNVHFNLDEYRQAKLNIINHQTSEDYAVINIDSDVCRSFAIKTKANIYWFSRCQSVKGSYIQNRQIIIKMKNKAIPVGNTDDLHLYGRHNWGNVVAAITAARLAGASIEGIKKAVYSFKGLPYRLELIKTINDVSFYNDSASTIPETAIAAIQSFSQPMILVLGGSDKNSDYSQLAREIVNKKNIKSIILIGAMAEKIAATLDQAGKFKGEIIVGLKTMSEVVNRAFQSANPQDIVILSPGCASFDMFKNYQDRGQQFTAAVNSLK